MADRRLSWKFLGDARDLDQANRTAQRSLDQTEGKTKKTDRAFSGLNTTLVAFAGAIGAAEVGRFALDAVKLSQAADQAAISAEKVLGPALDTLRGNLEGTREAMGLNRGELDEIAARFGLLTDSLGLTDEAQAEFIEGLITMGGDLAAFKGDVTDAPAAIDAFGSALKGEFDALESFGVKLSEAEVKERALKLALDPANEGLSDQELRIQAITELIAEKAAPAVGSLEEAMDDGKTAAQELNTKLEDMKIALGEKLAPAVEWVLGFLLDAIDAWDRLRNDFENTQLGAFVKELEPVGAVLKWILDNLLNIPAAIKTVKDVAKGIGNFFSSVAGGIGSVAKAIGVIPGFAKGGTVPGPKGSKQLVVAHGGEEITNPAMGGGSGGGDIYLTVQAGVGDPQEIAKTIVDVLRVYNQTNGALPVTVRSVE